MNDLQAQLEEVSKEKQELQEKVGAPKNPMNPPASWGLSPERGRAQKAGCWC